MLFREDVLKRSNASAKLTDTDIEYPAPNRTVSDKNDC